MDFILDNNKETEQKFKKILRSINLHQNGDVSDSMKSKGINYRLNWGVSLIELREIARTIGHDHLLALKLWNKNWRETLILATLIDEPGEVTEEQMDFWTKSFENSEIAEQASANLWVKSKFAFAKALEWCRGKKHYVRFTGVHLAGRLAIVDKKAIDEMFEIFFDEFYTLAKDKKLYAVLYRAVIAIGTRSKTLNEKSIEFAATLKNSDSETAVALGNELFDELSAPYIQERFE